MIKSSCLPLVGSIGSWRRRQGVLYLRQKRSLLAVDPIIVVMPTLELQHRRVLIRVAHLIIWLIDTLI